MENIVWLAVWIVALMTGQVTLTPLSAGDTFQFDYNGNAYWVKIDWWGTFNLKSSEQACELMDGWELVELENTAQYAEIRRQVAAKVPSDWNEVMLWTGDESEGDDDQESNVMLVIFRTGTDGINRKEDHPATYSGHGYICQKKMKQPGTTHYFEEGFDHYWFTIDVWGTYSFTEAKSECETKHSADLVKITSSDLLEEIEEEVEEGIPLDWNEVMLWTGDSKTEGSNTMLVVWREGTGGPNSYSERSPTYEGHGFICHKRGTHPGDSHEFEFGGYRYWFKIDWWGNVGYSDAVSHCREKYGAEVATAADDNVYGEMQAQIAKEIPNEWTEVMLWTRDSNTVDTNVMLIVRKDGVGVSNEKGDYDTTNYRGHGYICQKQL